MNTVSSGNRKKDDLRLYVNIDHVATIRQARRGIEPSPILAALLCEKAGVDGITAHLREDRRHIQDADIRELATAVSTVLNLECAAVEEMISLAEELRPYAVTLVPERREEVTTEGGLDILSNSRVIGDSIARLKRAGIKSSLFIDPDFDTIKLACDLGADAIELHTGPYSHEPENPDRLIDLSQGAIHARSLGMAVHAGHGLNVSNVRPVAAIKEIEELNIGHSIVSRSVFIGLEAAVTEMRKEMDSARAELQ